MKKQYTAPHIQVVELDNRDLIATSGVGIDEGPGSGIVGAPWRFGMDDDEFDIFPIK